MVFQKDVKRDQKVFLEQIQFQAGVKRLPGIMEIFLGKRVKFRGAFLDQNDRIDFLDIVVGEPFSLLAYYTYLVLKGEDAAEPADGSGGVVGRASVLTLDCRFWAVRADWNPPATTRVLLSTKQY